MCVRAWLSVPPASEALHGPQGNLIPKATWPPGLCLLLLLCFAAWGQRAVSPGRCPQPLTPPSPHTVCYPSHMHPQPQSLQQGSEQVARAKSHHLHTPPSLHTLPSGPNAVLSKFIRHGPSPWHNVEVVQVKHYPSVGLHLVGLGSSKRRTRGRRHAQGDGNARS